MNDVLQPNAFYWAWLMGSVSILIPRKNKKGWLKVPASHHASERTYEIERASDCDICGLDGTLDFDCGWDISSCPDKRVEFEQKVFPHIEKWYGVPRGHEVAFGEITKTLYGN